MQASIASKPNCGAVVIADRSPHFRETLRRVLQQGAGGPEIAGESSSLRDALRLVRSSGARVVLLDVDLVMNQPAARLRRIIDNLPGLRVIVLLDEDLPGYRLAITERWGYQCVAKEHAETEIPRALNTVQAGPAYPFVDDVAT
jgi:DNA-binding NarL/FixJ family response regulator